MLIAIAGILLLGGCASSATTRAAANSGAGAAAAGNGSSAPVVTDADRLYVIGPTAAREIGYRVDWQYPSGERPISLFEVSGDSVFTLDTNNFLTRLRRNEGERVWRIPVGGPVDEVYGINYVPEINRVFVTLSAEVLTLDAETGGQLAKAQLGKYANTSPVRYGPFLLYGSRNGQLVWHDYATGTAPRAYQISPTMDVAPVISDGYAVTVGSDGRIMCITVSSAAQVWSYRALGPITAKPTAGNGVAFVASHDQHLRAFDLAANRPPIWQYLTESPLTESPVLIGDRLYEQIPSEGLVCFVAVPFNKLGGEVIWTADSEGNVLTKRAGDLLVWSDSKGSLDVVDDRLGAVVKSVTLPQVRTLIASDVNEGDLFATSADGRLVRLVPRN